METSRKEELLALLRAKREIKSASAIARELGYSPTVISLVLGGKYAGDTTKVLEKVAEVYSTEEVICPVMGAIKLSRCRAEQRKESSPTSPQRMQLATTCPTCFLKV